MYVVIKHRIDDAESFDQRGQTMVGQAPDGVRPLQFLPDSTFTEAVCLWEGPSVDAVRSHVDGSLGDSAVNEYFGVNEAAALGLPSVQTA